MRPLPHCFQFQPDPSGGLSGCRLGGRKPECLAFQVSLAWPYSSRLWNGLPARVRDLLGVVQAVVAADRLSPRLPDREGNGWNRPLKVALPVRELDFWNERKVQDALTGLLTLLTDDYWSFEWYPHPRTDIQVSQVAQASLLDVDAPPTGCILQSGGLDSFAEACALLAEGKSSQYALVSVVTADRVAGMQRNVRRALDERFRGRTYPVEWRLHLSHSLSGPGLHRSRSFAFQGLGAIAAFVVGSRFLYQCENGYASLCLPLVSGSFPWQTAQGVHPRFLHDMGAFLSLVFGSDFQVLNPFLFQTKAEMCAAIRGVGLERAVSDTISCDRFPQRVAGRPACGKCAPCVYRRLSLCAAGLEQHDHACRYRYDVTASATLLQQESRIALDAMLSQRERIWQSIGSRRPWMTLTQYYLELETNKRYIAASTAKSEALVEKELCSMLKRSLWEWEFFSVCAGYSAVTRVGDRRRVRQSDSSQLTLSLCDPGIQGN